MSAKAFLGGFLDGFTMAGIWKPSLKIPGAATQLFRAEPEEISRKELELMLADVLEEDWKLNELFQTQSKGNDAWRNSLLEKLFGQRAAAQKIAESEIEMELTVLYWTAVRRAKELGLDEEQMNRLHARILERLSNAENPQGRRIRTSESEHPTR